MRQAVHLARIEDMRKAYTQFSLENMMVRQNLEDLRVDGKIILNYIVKKQDGKVCSDLIWPRTGKNGRLL
jgi:hypothetical protein